MPSGRQDHGSLRRRRAAHRRDTSTAWGYGRSMWKRWEERLPRTIQLQPARRGEAPGPGLRRRCRVRKRGVPRDSVRSALPEGGGKGLTCFRTFPRRSRRPWSTGARPLRDSRSSARSTRGVIGCRRSCPRSVASVSKGTGCPRGAVLDGASFMAPCTDFTGQTWRLKPSGNGTYQLLTLTSEGRGECLEGNRVVAGAEPRAERRSWLPAGPSPTSAGAILPVGAGSLPVADARIRAA